MKKILLFASMSISMLAIATMMSCSENKNITSDSKDEAVTMTRSSLDNHRRTFVVKFTSDIKPRLGELKSGERDIFSSDNPDVATVDRKGMVTGVSSGIAHITVKRLDAAGIVQISETFDVTITDYIYIADRNFKAYLVGNTNINKNGNNEIEANEAIDFNGYIDIRNNSSVFTLDGLEYFENLKRLNCSNTRIAILDVCANTELESLDCSNCKQLTGTVPWKTTGNELNLKNNPR